jgi:hypothetical protein
VPTNHQSRTGPTRAAPVRSRRKVLPYELTNADGGAAILPQSIPSVGQPTGQLSGENSETATDAGNNQSGIENEALVSDLYYSHILRTSG